MNRNELEAEFTRCLPNGLVCEILGKFFDTNICIPICIPKGTNRHIHADMIHAHAEGAVIEYREKWEVRFTSTKYPSWDINTEYRIKPYEPIYEWQYLILAGLDGVNELSLYYTDEEFANSGYARRCIKLEETKRERK